MPHRTRLVQPTQQVVERAILEHDHNHVIQSSPAVDSDHRGPFHSLGARARSGTHGSHGTSGTSRRHRPAGMTSLRRDSLPAFRVASAEGLGEEQDSAAWRSQCPGRHGRLLDTGPPLRIAGATRATPSGLHPGTQASRRASRKPPLLSYRPLRRRSVASSGPTTLQRTLRRRPRGQQAKEPGDAWRGVIERDEQGEDGQGLTHRLLRR